MKNRVNQILLAAFFLTAALYVYFLLVWIEGIPRPFYDPADPFHFYELWVYLGVGFHAVPCFLLQLLVCRVAKYPWVRLIPVFLLLGIAALFAMFLEDSLDSDAWDARTWGAVPASDYEKYLRVALEAASRL